MADVTPGKEIETQHHHALVRAIHGAGLTRAQLAIVRQRVGDIVDAAEAMRAVRLDNADEPFSVFAPHDPGAAE
jgi:anti-sigma factor RsiW